MYRYLQMLNCPLHYDNSSLTLFFTNCSFCLFDWISNMNHFIYELSNKSVAETML